MNSGLHRIDVTGGLFRLAGRPRGSGGLSTRPDDAPGRTFTPGFVALLAVLIAGLGVWLLSGYGSNTAESEPVHLATAVATEPAPTTSPDVALDLSLPNPAATPAEAPPVVEAAPAELSPVEGLKISSQSWRRGGLGSKAVVTFTLRNGNDYAVKDIEILCAFTRRDGSHLTDRRRMIHDTVRMKSRKTFARMHIGFVNINANQARCSLVAASRL